VGARERATKAHAAAARDRAARVRQCRLALELDGPGHDRTRTQREDERKEAAWRADGFEVLRFKETQLRAATHAVAARVL
jgi:very-short-patch-repair endonuclease